MARRQNNSGTGERRGGRRSAYDKALTLLARREQSRRELGARLQRAGYDEDEAESALTQLGAQGYQDDARFAAMLARSRIRQGYGPARIHAELRSHGIADADIAAALVAEPVDWPALAAAQLARHYGSAAATDVAARARRAQYLLRRGFDAAIAYAVVHADDDALPDTHNS